MQGIVAPGFNSPSSPPPSPSPKPDQDIINHHIFIPVVTVICIKKYCSGDTARHSATSGSLDLSIHNTEVQVGFQIINHHCVPNAKIEIKLSRPCAVCIHSFSHPLSLLHAAVSQVGKGWYLVVQVLNTHHLETRLVHLLGIYHIYSVVPSGSN